MEHNQLILSAKDVNIQFNLRGKVLHAIRGIDLDLYQGEVLAIVGERLRQERFYQELHGPAGCQRLHYQRHH